MGSEQALSLCLKCSRRLEHMWIYLSNLRSLCFIVETRPSLMTSPHTAPPAINIKNQSKQHLQDPLSPPSPRDSLISWAASSPMRSSWSSAGSFSRCQVKKWKRQRGSVGLIPFLMLFIKGQSHFSSCWTWRWKLRLITDLTRCWNTNRLRRLPWLLWWFLICPWAEAIKARRRRRRHRQAKRFVDWRWL